MSKQQGRRPAAGPPADDATRLVALASSGAIDPTRLSDSELATLIGVLEADANRLEAARAKRKQRIVTLQSEVLSASKLLATLQARQATWQADITARAQQLARLELGSEDEKKKRADLRTEESCQRVLADHVKDAKQLVKDALLNSSCIPDASLLTSHPSHPAHEAMQAELQQRHALITREVAKKREELKAYREKQANIDANAERDIASLPELRANAQKLQAEREENVRELARSQVAAEAQKARSVAWSTALAQPSAPVPPELQQDPDWVARQKTEAAQEVILAGKSEAEWEQAARDKQRDLTAVEDQIARSSAKAPKPTPPHQPQATIKPPRPQQQPHQPLPSVRTARTEPVPQQYGHVMSQQQQHQQHAAPPTFSQPPPQQPVMMQQAVDQQQGMWSASAANNEGWQPAVAPQQQQQQQQQAYQQQTNLQLQQMQQMQSQVPQPMPQQMQQVGQYSVQPNFVQSQPQLQQLPPQPLFGSQFMQPQPTYSTPAFNSTAVGSIVGTHFPHLQQVHSGAFVPQQGYQPQLAMLQPQQQMSSFQAAQAPQHAAHATNQYVAQQPQQRQFQGHMQ